MERPLAVVTGASSGIGRAIARLLARDAHDLLLVARREDRLVALEEELAAFGVRAGVCALDLSRSDAPARVKERANAMGRVSLLVNNAGLGRGGLSWEDPARQLEMIDLNVRSLVELTNLFLPSMLERRSGQILNLASIAAFQPVPYMAVYSATKAFVVSYTAALAQELRDTGVTATAVCPGPVETEFSDVAGVTTEGVGPFVQTAEEVAACALDAARAGRAVTTTGVAPAATALLVKLAPRGAAAAVSGFIMRRTIAKASALKGRGAS
jgi:short-subunit dehydrogenase